MFPESNGETMTLFDAGSLLEQRERLLTAKKALEAEVDEINNQIKAEMGDNERAVCDRWTVSWKTQSKRTFDVKELAKEYPMIDLDRYYKTSESRVFRVTEKKEDKAS